VHTETGVYVNARAPGVVFLIIGIALIAVGIGGRSALLYAGLAFLVIGLVQMTRRKTG
jgi:uncharacterized membrane protein YkgB